MIINQNIPLVVLGIGRSGTTLVFRLLNSQDEVFISGEHGGFLTGLARAYHQIENLIFIPSENISLNKVIKKTDESKDKPSHAWENKMFNKKIAKEKIKNLFEELFLIDRNYLYFGFKEIIYPENRKDKTIDFIIKEYPLSKFIFVFRNPLEVIKSQYINFKKNDFVKLAEEWSKKNNYLLDYYKKYPDNIIFVNYDKLISNDKEKILNKIGFFLKINWDHLKSSYVFDNGGNITNSNIKTSLKYDPGTENSIKRITGETYTKLQEITNSL
jgi:hypothetical protein